MISGKGVISFGCAPRNSDFELTLIFGSHMLNIGKIQTQNELLILLFLELNYEMVYSSITYSLTIIKIFFRFVLLEFSGNIQVNKPSKCLCYRQLSQNIAKHLRQNCIANTLTVYFTLGEVPNPPYYLKEICANNYFECKYFLF